MTAFPSAANCSAGAVLAWQDARQSYFNRSVYVARVDASGQLTPPDGLRLSGHEPGLLPGPPSIACSGSRCLVAWIYGKGAIAHTLFDCQNLMITGRGLLSAERGIAVSNVTVASTFNRFVIGWANGSDLELVWVDRNGLVIAALRSVYTSTMGGVSQPRLFPAGTDVGLAFLEAPTSSLNLGVVTQGGALMNQLLVGQTAPFASLSLEADATTAYVGWLDSTLRTTLQRVNLSTVSSIGSAVLVGKNQNAIGIALNREGADLRSFQVAAYDDVETFGISSTTGTMSTPVSRIVSTVGGVISRVASANIDGGSSLVAHTESMTANAADTTLRVGVVQSLVDGGVTLPLPPSMPMIANSTHQWPAGAWTSNGIVLAWANLRNQRAELQSISLDSMGRPVADPSLLTQAATSMGYARLFWDGARIHSILTEKNEVAWRPLDPAGIPTGPAVTITTGALMENATAVSIAGSIWSFWASLDTGYNLYGRRLSSTGPTGASVNLVTVPSVVTSLDATASSTQGLLAWVSNFTARVSRVSSTGVALDGQGIVVGSPSVDVVRVASNGTDFVVVWGNWLIGAGFVNATRVLASGTLLDASPIQVASIPQFERAARAASPSVQWTGSDYVITWQGPSSDGGAFDIYSRRLASSGTLGPVEVINSSPGNQEQGFAFSDGAGKVAVSFVEWDATEAASRTRLAILLQALDGGMCTLDGDCSFGVCVGGQCRITSMTDGGTADAGLPDGGASDAGNTDAGVPDGGVTDGGTLDGGMDAGIDDGGIDDAGVSDAGESDGGDGGQSLVDDPLSRAFQVQCGCGSAGFPHALWFGLCLAALRLTLGTKRRSLASSQLRRCLKRR